MKWCVAGGGEAGLFIGCRRLEEGGDSGGLVVAGN
jgi:hypothetical protein